MKKIYIVRLTDEKRQICLAIVKKLKGTSTKVRRVNILLKADTNGAVAPSALKRHASRRHGITLDEWITNIKGRALRIFLCWLNRSAAGVALPFVN